MKNNLPCQKHPIFQQKELTALPGYIRQIAPVESSTSNFRSQIVPNTKNSAAHRSRVFSGPGPEPFSHMIQVGKNPEKPWTYVGVSKNRGIPKWMVKIMENPIKVDDLGGKPTIFGSIHMQLRKQTTHLPRKPPLDLDLDLPVNSVESKTWSINVEGDGPAVY